MSGTWSVSGTGRGSWRSNTESTKRYVVVVVVVVVFICCLQENARVMAKFEGKLKVLEAREYALALQERDVAAREEELRQREESLKVRERGYDQMCVDLEAECWEFRRQFRMEHKVFVVCCGVSDYVCRIAICQSVMWMISTLGITLLMSYVILLISTLAMG